MPAIIKQQISAMTKNTPHIANGSQNGNQTQNQVNVSGKTLVNFKIKKTNQVNQHKLPNEIVDVPVTLIFC